jgi:hypothetical protein
MHNAKCAQQHTLELHKALGMGAGEPAEPANGFLGKPGGVLQYCRKGIRVIWLEAQILSWQRKKVDDLPDLLLRTWHKARLMEQHFVMEQCELGQQALACGVSLDEVSHSMAVCCCAQAAWCDLEARDCNCCWAATHMGISNPLLHMPFITLRAAIVTNVTVLLLFASSAPNTQLVQVPSIDSHPMTVMYVCLLYMC